MHFNIKSGSRTIWITLLIIIMVFSTLFPSGISAVNSANADTKTKADTITKTGGKTVKASSLVKETPILVATGNQLIGGTLPAANSNALSLEKSWTQAELDVMMESSQPLRFTTVNSANTKKFYEGIGISIADLLGGKTGNLTTVSKDGPSYISFHNTATKRYFFPYIAGYGGEANPENGAVEVPYTLIFKGRNYDALATSDPFANFVTTSFTTTDTPVLHVGQLTSTEVSNSSFNKRVNTLRLGDALPAILAVNGSGTPKQYTRAELLLMKRVPAAPYEYQTETELKTDYARGVDLADLITEADEDYIVEFTTSDGSSIDPKTVKEIRLQSTNGTPYILAYEFGDSASDLKAVVDDNGGGHLRLYHDSGNPYFDTPAKAIVKVEAIDPTEPLVPKGYSHIDYTGSPYNISAITGATLTVEGPAVQNGEAISVVNLESAKKENVHTGNYTDMRLGIPTERSYQGVKVESILDGKINGTGTVDLLDQDANIVFKNRWRNTVATVPLQAIRDANSPLILAWGTAFADGTNPRPFVYNGADGKYQDPSGDNTLGNEDGCLKLVYDKDDFPGGTNAIFDDGNKFSSVAYIYVEESVDPPGYLHDEPPYDNVQNTQQIISFGGSALESEINFTVEELEEMAAEDIADGGDLVHRAEYGLTNTTYWYVNEYEGLKLWELLKKFGLDESYKNDNETPVTVRAWDNYKTAEKFTTAEIASPGSFYFYEKASNDIGTSRPDVDKLIPPDGSIFTEYDKNGYPVKKGYPVMLAYGVNKYPYVRDTKLSGYKSGIDNSGGPMRVIFGKREYYHNNGSNQLQKVDAVFAGNPVPYSTHKYNETNPVYQPMADQTLTVEINKANGAQETKTFTIGEIEDLLHASNITPSQRTTRQEKAYYYHKDSGSGDAVQDLFEGINLWYLLQNVVEVPGYIGDVTFNDDPNQTVSLDRIRAQGYNSVSGTSGLDAILAFSQNGYPLVENNSSSGYVNTHPNYSEKAVDNAGGPLLAVLPQTETQNDDGNIDNDPVKFENINKITINLEADNYAHDFNPYAAYTNNNVLFVGGVKNDEVNLNVERIESKQAYMVTDVYGNGASAVRYRGIDLYKLLNDAQISMSAQVSQVNVYNAAGDSISISAADLASGIEGQKVILAYGSNADIATDAALGLPLVEQTTSPGYNAAFKNSGGPLKLVVPPTGKYATNSVIENVTEIEVEVSEVSGWKHSYGVYESYKDVPALVISGSEVEEPRTFTVGELEALDRIIIQDDYELVDIQQIQGVKLWELIRDEVGLKEGITKPSRILLNSEDNNPIDITGQIENIIEGGINGMPVLIGFGQNGYPLVPNTDSPGYHESAGNLGGPLRIFVNANTGWCEKWLCSIVVGEGESIKPTIPQTAFSVKFPEGGLDKKYTLPQFKDAASSIETTANYTYNNNGGEAVKGTRLDSFLESLGYDLTLNSFVTLHTSNGDENDPSSNLSALTPNELTDNDYFVAWEASGQPINDKVNGSDENTTSLRLYRNENLGNDDANIVKNITGITITAPWDIMQNPNNIVDPMVRGVRNIVPAKGGGIFYATTYGLYKFDEDNNFVTDYTPLLENEFIYDVAEDEDGGLYVTQGNDYINPLHNKGIAYIPADAENPGDVTYYDLANNNLPHNFTQAVEVLPDGDVLIGSFGGLTRYSPNDGTGGSWTTYTQTEGLPALSVSVLTQDSNGVWIGCYPDQTSGSEEESEFSGFNGGYAYMTSEGEFSFVKKYLPTDYEGDLLADYWVRDIVADGIGGAYVVRSGSYADLPNVGGRIDYVSHSRNVTEFTGQSLIKDLRDLATPTTQPEIRRMTVDGAGNLWYGTSGIGVYKATSLGDSNPIRYTSGQGNWNDTSLENIYAITAVPNGTIYADAAWKLFKESKEQDPAQSDTLLRIKTPEKQVSFTKADYDKIPKLSHTYSSYNTMPVYSSNKRTGVELKDIFSSIGIDTSAITDNTLVTFDSNGSYAKQLTWKQLNENRYFYNNRTKKGAQVPAMLSYTKEDGLTNYFGQASASEQTSQAFVNNITSITIEGNAGSWPTPASIPSNDSVIVPDEQIMLTWANIKTSDAKIHYTLDGSEPDADSPMFNKTAFYNLPSGTDYTPIVASSTGSAFTMKAQLMGLGKDPSKTVSFNYKIYREALPDTITKNQISSATFGSWKGTGKSSAAVIPGDLGTLIFDHFTSLKLGSATLNNGHDYILKRGGLSVELTETYLKKLKNGNHTFSLTYSVNGTQRFVELPISVTQLPTGWKTEGGKKVYYNPNGTKAKNWQKIGGKQYYFGSNGVMQTKWKKIGKNNYYFGTNGVMQTKWKKIGKAKYYFGTNGKMQTKWKKIGKAKYYFGTNGKMQTKWKKIGKAKYYFGTNGKMQTKWKKIGKKKYYFGTNGKMQTGKKKIGKKTYRFSSSGALKK